MERRVRSRASRLKWGEHLDLKTLMWLSGGGGEPVVKYLPAVPDDTTVYPMVLRGYGTLVVDGSETYTSPTISEGKLFRNTNTSGISDVSKFSYCSRTYLPTTQSARANHTQYFTTTSGYCDFIDNDYSTVALFKAALSADPVTILYAKATPDDSVWKFVKDVGGDFGYYNEATDAFVKAFGATGTVIQRISYAETDGSAYIDTGVFGNENTKITLDFQKTGSNTAIQIVGSITTSTAAITCNLGTGTGPISRFGSKSKSIVMFSDFNRHSLIIANDGFVADGNNLWVPDSDDFSTSDTLFLLSAHSSSAIFIGKLYSARFEDAVPVRDYIPVRIGTTVELLDLVSWSFATRVGTLTAGADIPWEW